MSVVAAIFFLPSLVSCYNVDVGHAVLLGDRNGSYFGYSVLLYSNGTGKSSWLFVGAPRGNYSEVKGNRANPDEPGVVYRCTLSKECSQIIPNVTDDENGNLGTLRLLIRKAGGWFGAAMSIEKLFGTLTVCAPRTIVHLANSKILYWTMQGTCYSNSISSNRLYNEDNNFTNHNFTTDYWYNPIYGFSIHYREAERKIYRIVGEPYREIFGAVEILEMDQKRRTIELPEDDEIHMFGYAVTTGRFFGKDRVLYVGGAPRAQQTGRVAVIDPYIEKRILQKLSGVDMGEYFGASLAVGDLNGDGFDDLVVGSPHWGPDSGRASVYLGNEGKFLRHGVTLEGAADDGQFAYSLACGDLDRDGFADLIVGAPWEDSGVLYVYNGQSSIDEGVPLKASQRIHASEVSPRLRTFGFSISEPVDMDDNGYPEIAIGAYDSSHAVVLYGKPVIQTSFRIVTHPKILSANPESFVVTICIGFSGVRVSSPEVFAIDIEIDLDNRRVNESTFSLFVKTSPEVEECTNRTIKFVENVRNFVDPIKIQAKYRVGKRDTNGSFCKRCPILERGKASKTALLTLPFDIGCKNQICYSNISIAASFRGTLKGNVWVIGSGNVTLEVTLTNHGEPAHLTSVVFTIPEGVVLHSVLPFCQEDTGNSTLTVTCDGLNLPGGGAQKTIPLDLDTKLGSRGIEYERQLNFRVTVTTRSTNQGEDEVDVTPLYLRSEASLAISGTANAEYYHLSRRRKRNSDEMFTHTYRVLKLGATPIQEARLVVEVPVASSDDSEPFLSVYKPLLYVSEKAYECSSADIVFLAHRADGSFRDDSGEDLSLGMNRSEDWSIGLEVTTSLPFERTKRDVFERAKGNVSETSNAGNEAEGWLEQREAWESVELNCRRGNVTCARIECGLGLIESSKDVVKLHVTMAFNSTKFLGISGETEKKIRLTTAARVDIVQPADLPPLEGTRLEIELTTTFFGVPRTKQITYWLLLGSVILGLVVLSLFVGLLSRFGFFDRRKKQELEALKATGSVTKVNGNEHSTE